MMLLYMIFVTYMIQSYIITLDKISSSNGGGGGGQGTQQPKANFNTDKITLSFNNDSKDPQKWGANNVGWMYTGKQIKPIISDIYDELGNKLVRDTDYKIFYSYSGKYPERDGIKASKNGGGGVICIDGLGDYAGIELEQMFHIDRRTLTKENVTIRVFSTNNQAGTPTITYAKCTQTQDPLVEDKDYKVIEFKEVDGVGVVKIEGMGNYKGTAEVVYQLQLEWKDIEMIMKPENFEYNGKQQVPNVTLKYKGRELVLDRDYTILETSTDCVNPSEQYPKIVTVIGKGNYSALTANTKTYFIGKKTITSDMITLSPTSYDYDGTTKVPTVTVKNGDLILKEGTDFDVEYTNNTNVGTATVTITGKGTYYKGTASKHFTIKKKEEQSTPVDEPTDNPGENTNPNNPTDNPTDDPTDNPTDTPTEEKLSVKIQDKYKTKNINSEKYITQIPQNTSIDSFKQSIKTNGEIKLYNVKDKSNDKSVIKTGMKLEVIKGTEKISYILVVNGDVTGDGRINGADLLRVARYIAELDLDLTGAYEIAADVYTEDSSNVQINGTDLLKLSRVLAGLE